MESALIVSVSEKSIKYFSDVLKLVFCNEIITVPSCGEARRMLLNREFDLCIINSPLKDEFGENLALHITSRSMCQVILIVKTEFYDNISANVEDSGVITVIKPIDRNLFWNVIKIVNASYKKMQNIQSENIKLLQKIEDIRVIDRAKCILIANLNFNESEAHKHIEKLAMDTRMTRREIAERIVTENEKGTLSL